VETMTDERYTLEGVLQRLRAEKAQLDQVMSHLKSVASSEWANPDFAPSILLAAQGITPLLTYIEFKIQEFENAIKDGQS
jgi:hypothetical protein